MAERFEIVEKALLKLLEEKKYATLRDILTTMNPMDVAGLFDGLDEKQIPLMFRLLPKEQAAETFVEMEPEAKELLIRGFSDNELKEVLDELYVDDAADIVEEMPANVVQRILKHADPEMRSSINQILRYPEDSAGSIMTTEYVSLRPHMTVEEAILRIRRQGVDKETIYTCYVTEKDRTLIGLVTVKDLLLAADDETKIEDIMETNLISVTTQTDQEEVAATLSKYNFIALPVVDGENRMVGIVTFDDAMDVMQDAATEDMEIMAAMTPSEKTYLKSTPFDLFKHRIPWLMLLMVSATFTGMIITSFEDALSLLPVLTAFIPMLMDTGGNCGSQSSVTVIRALSLDGDVEGSPHGSALRRGAGSCLLPENSAGRSAADGQRKHQPAGQRRGVPDALRDGHFGQVCRLHAAPVCQAPGLRPGGDGKPLYHDHRGRPELAGVFPVCEAPAGCLKRKTSYDV